MSGACCMGCGKAEPSDYLLDAVVAEASPAGEAVTPAVIERCARAVAARLDVERIAYFAPVRSDPAWSRQTAEHEVAHAVVGMWFGAEVEGVDIDAAVCCRFTDLSDLSPLQRVLVHLAGHAAGRDARPLDLSFCSRMARAGVPKSCDRCKAVAGVAGTMPDGTDTEWLAAYRAMEDRAVRLVRYRPVAEAIGRVADALVARGHLSGGEVAALAGPAITGAKR